MARSFQNIKATITQSFITNATIIAMYELVEGQTFEQQFSKVSIENIIFDIVSFGIYLLEQIFDTHVQEVDNMLTERLTPNEKWLSEMAKSFQYGYSLVQDKDYYDNNGLTVEEIAASKIIKYAAVPKSNSGTILIKVATEVGGVLTPLTVEQKQAFEEFIKEIIPAGSSYMIVNYNPDKLLLNLKIYVDTLVIGTNGINILTGEKSVETAINSFLKQLPFDGELVLAGLIDELQKVPGVKIPHLVFAETIPIDPVTDLYVEFPQPLEVKTIPVAGYFTVPNYDNITYVV